MHVYVIEKGEGGIPQGPPGILSSVDSADILRVKNLVEIALSRTVSEINAFLRFTKKFKMAKHGGKTIFGKSHQ